MIGLRYLSPAWPFLNPFSMLRFAFILLIALIPGIASARIYKPWTPDDLFPISQLICKGVVVKIDNLGEEKTPPGTWWSGTRWKAHIKLLFIVKGQAPPEFDFFYTEKFAPTNGPMNFTLKEGQRYRFYLNPTPVGKGYISALDANIDNVWWVEPLGSP